MRCRATRIACAASLWLLLAGQASVAQPPAQQATLPNGLVVLHSENLDSLTLAVACFVRVSALWETAETAGWRNLLQQTLLDLRDESGRSLAVRAAEDGVSINVQTTSDYTEALFRGTGDQLTVLLGLAREFLAGGRLDRESVRRRQQEALRQILQRRETLLAWAEDMLRKALFAQTPLSWPVVGTSAVSGISMEQLERWRRLHYAPNRTIIAMSGPVRWAEVRAQAEETFGALVPRPTFPEPRLMVTRRRRSLVWHSPWEGDNAVVALGALYPGPQQPEFATAAILGAVFGSGEGSRLFQALREQEGLAYTMQTELVPSRLAAMLQTTVMCEAARAPEVLRVMQQQVARLVTQPPTEEEVQRARAYLTSTELLGGLRNEDRAHYLGLWELLLPGQGATRSLGALCEKVTVAQVAAAARWLQDQQVWIQVGGKPL